MGNFDCIVLSPLGLSHSQLAIAAVRAGGIGILDGEFCPDWEGAESSLQQLIVQSGEDGNIGLRLTAAQLASCTGLLQALACRWLIVAHWQTSPDELLQLPPAPGRRLLLEATQAHALDSAQELGLVNHGWVVRGSESGGWGGEDFTFILTQKLLARTQALLYIQGGIGVHTAAACRAGGGRRGDPR